MTIHALLTADNHLDPSAVQYAPRRFERKRDFLQDPRPTPKMFHFGGENVNVTGMSLSPGLGPEQDPLAGQEVSREGDVNIFLTHYPIEGFEGYFGQETHIGKSSIPRDYQLF